MRLVTLKIVYLFCRLNLKSKVCDTAIIFLLPFYYFYSTSVKK